MMISQGLTVFQGQVTGTAYNLLMAGSLIQWPGPSGVSPSARSSRASPWVPSAKRNQDGGTGV